MRKGKISVKSENILPIIKKWLYSDKDIFIRELVSNASDAIFKYERLLSCGEVVGNDERYSIIVSVDKDKGILSISDNGIGMTEQEVKKYIAQVAFSGAVDFIEKFEHEPIKEGIIGHFGLGFYSAFMVSNLVEIDSLSYKDGAQAVKWVCDGGPNYKVGISKREHRGTTITLHISDENKEFLEDYRIKEVVGKYCSFISYDILFDSENDDTPTTVLNNVKPLWLKNTNECTDEEYKQFYRDVFHEYQDPLFWIHLNVDSPFQLKAIIYFPKLSYETDLSSFGEIKLYYNQVFVADNIKEILPDFLMVLKGVIDCPDIPINVSRSALQNETSVIQISRLISKKVCEKLHCIFEDSREQYNHYWKDIHVLVKYGCIRDRKFFERMSDAIVFKTTDGNYLTINEYVGQLEDRGKVVYYSDDITKQASNIAVFKKNNIEVLDMTHPIDLRFLQEVEFMMNDVKFVCVTSELPGEMMTGQIVEESDVDEFANMFRTALDKPSIGVQAEYFKDNDTPIILSLSEQSRRYQEMRRYSQNIVFDMNLSEEYTITVNCSNSLMQELLRASRANNKNENVMMICKQLYMLALTSHRQLTASEKQDYICDYYRILDIAINS